MHITEPLPTDKKARLVFGLDWRAYPVKGARSERRRYADDFGATHFVEYRIGKETIAGFAAPESQEIRGAKLYSGAARIAMHARVKTRPATLVLLQDEQRIHLVFVVRGAVRNDEVLTPEQANERRQAIANECLRLNLPLTTLGMGQSVGVVDETFSAAALLENRKSARVTKLPVSIPAAVPLAIIAVALFVAGSRIYDAVQPPPPPPPHEPTYAEKYAEALRREFSTPLPRASLLAPALLSVLGTNESNLSGWRFEHADCGVSGNCSITRSREGGTYAVFDRDATPSMRPVKFDADGLHLTTVGAAVPKVATVLPSESAGWPSEQVLISQLQTPAQRLSLMPFELASQGYSVTIWPSKPVFQDQSGAGPRPAHKMRVGDWTIDGFRWQAVLLERLPPNMAIQSLKVEFQDKDKVGIHFTAKGKYYVLD
jgi:hypothetical protein